MAAKQGYQPSIYTSTAVAGRPLDGQLTIITGGSRGIGAAVAENLARKGSNLILNYTAASSVEKAEQLAKRLTQEHGIQVLPVQADLGTLDGPANIVAAAKDNFVHPKTGKFVINNIVNNAGVGSNVPLEDCTIDDFSRQYNINVRGPLLLVQAALPYLPTDRSGRIINVSSVSSSLGFIGQTIYGGTKAALEAMTRTWARELAERATVNAVNPGPVATDMYGCASREFQDQIRPFIETTPLSKSREGIDHPDIVKADKLDGGRPAYDWEIAGVVAMLCHEDASWCTGSVICANGGMKFSS